ncbi:PREDICTED: armadillo repeat-containing protein 5, partial [Nanorana parkeri]|uniref:armadillo repeat-containing protein 5 n=1 Tax=Nanorana parkeri TaxID=125878 RepID=UPI00085463F2
VRDLGGIPALICILQSVCIDSIWNRVSRALGNLAVDSQNSRIIHDSGAVSSLVHILQTSQDAGCLQSGLRALRILGDSLSHRLSICHHGGLAPCVQMLSSPNRDVLCAAVRAICELSRGCSLDCAEQLSPAVPSLVALAGEEPEKSAVRQAVFGTLCNLCNQGALRPMLGNAGIIKLLITEAVAVQESPTRCLPLVRALCFCCREAVNRVRVRELGGLELLVALLRSPLYGSVHHRIIVALLHYCHDNAALSLLSLGGLAPLLAGRLEEVARTAEERGGAQRDAPHEAEERGSASYDFPPEPTTKKEPGGSSEESLRSWLLSEGYINSLEDLPPDWAMENREESTKTMKRTPIPPMSCQSPIQGIFPSLVGPRVPAPPEVYGPEFPVLLLLSRFSHLSDPASSLVSHPVLKGLLTYVTFHPNPSNRAARLLQRLTCDPLCLEAFIRTGSICTLRTRLLLHESPDGEDEERSRHPERDRELGHILLRNLCIQAESPFGVGLITHMLVSGIPSDRQQCALCLPFIYRKDSPQRQNLLGGAIGLVLEPLMVSVEPEYVFHASECLSSILAPHASPPLPESCPLIAPACRYLELCSQGRGGDVVFVLDGGERLEGRRDLVSTSCEVFRAMLQGGYAESQQREVHVREVPLCAFLPLLHYLHGCSQDSSCPALQRLRDVVPDQELDQSPLASTLAAAGRFILPDLQCVLETTVRDALLTLDSLPAIYTFAEVHESAQLRRDCCLYLLQRRHPPRRRARTLHQLCERAQDKRQLCQHLQHVLQGRD